MSNDWLRRETARTTRSVRPRAPRSLSCVKDRMLQVFTQIYPSCFVNRFLLYISRILTTNCCCLKRQYRSNPRNVDIGDGTKCFRLCSNQTIYFPGHLAAYVLRTTIVVQFVRGYHSLSSCWRFCGNEYSSLWWSSFAGIQNRFLGRNVLSTLPETIIHGTPDLFTL